MIQPARTVAALLIAFQALNFASCAGAVDTRAGQGDYTRYLPLDHPAYHYIDLLQSRGRLLSLDPALRPYTRAAVLAALDKQGGAGLKEIERVWAERIRKDCRVDTEAAESADPQIFGVVGRVEAAGSYRNLRPDREQSLAGVGFGGRFSHLTYDVRFLRAPQLMRLADTTSQHDPEVLPPAEEGLIRPVEGYLKVDFGLADGAFSSEIFFGRLARNWSPAGGRSLVLSAQALSFDHLGFCLRTRHLVFSHYVAALDDMLQNQPYFGQPVRFNRYFSAHRLDVRVRDNVRFGISETTVYGGENRGFDPALMNPFTSFRLVQIQNKRDWSNNTFLGLDAFTCFAGRMSFYGQFLFDDFLREPKIQDRWALDAGLSLRDPLPGSAATTLQIGLTVVSSFAYNTFQPYERYLLAGRPLGAPLGNDYWRAEGKLAFHLSGVADLGLFASRTKRGALRIASPAVLLLDSARLPFPTEPVAETSEAGLELWWQFSASGHLSARGGIIDQRRLENRLSENRTRGFFNIGLSLYRDLIVKF